ncbi:MULTISPECIES: alginate lyase family protein [unclassified Streptomyces]|uniref:alginate lyase family protein n=1 Tax=unclassified Streptomyces TaxID=2593676 RepID=UPI002258F0F9|nr:MULTISPECIES: alginate lyase family protein [unclassified Streptomyces]MCX5058556.1 alginate lyase family protein [Streptomyces sp. NBC_00452]MCX5289704.1 alginate lyase family protein [Streptomyces sp. NBC_00183]
MSGRSRAAVLLAAVVTFGAVLVPSAQAAPRAPDTAVLDGARLQQTKLRLDRGDPQLHRALRDLTARADNWLGQGPWTVVDKPKPAPGGDAHDYLSQAPYWWPSTAPTADNPWGCPYVQRDGQRNPEVDSGTDRQDVEKVFDSTYDLSLAWYYTGRRTYAEKAAQVLRTWFLAPATRMNPNLNHAQFIPCKYDGRAIGIIDFSQSYTSVVDALAILGTGAPGWTKSDRTGMTRWNSDFLGWLKNSAFGKEEGAAANNHGTFYDMQLAALAYATGDRALARRTVLDARAKRIDPQIAGDGSQPQELARTRSWHYSTFDLVAYTRLAAIGRHVGVDLWSYQGPDGQGLSKAVDYLLPAATGAAPWPHPELEFHRYAASDVVHAAADAGDGAAQTAVRKLEAPPGGDLWALRPAAEQLDSIAG